MNFKRMRALTLLLSTFFLIIGCERGIDDQSRKLTISLQIPNGYSNKAIDRSKTTLQSISTQTASSQWSGSITNSSEVNCLMFAVSKNQPEFRSNFCKKSGSSDTLFSFGPYLGGIPIAAGELISLEMEIPSGGLGKIVLVGMKAQGDNCKIFHGSGPSPGQISHPRVLDKSEFSLDSKVAEVELKLPQGSLVGLEEVGECEVGDFAGTQPPLSPPSAPTVSSITMPTDGFYTPGSFIDFDLVFTDSVDVTGSPFVRLHIMGTGENANYVSGSGTNTLSFRYTVQSDKMDLRGVKWDNMIDLNGGSIVSSTTGIGISTSLTPPSTSKIYVVPQAPALWLDFADMNQLKTSASCTGANPTSANDPVGCVLDKSGNNRNFNQATVARQPVISASGLNGLNTLSFDGSNDFLTFPDTELQSGGGLSIYAVSTALTGSILSKFDHGNQRGISLQHDRAYTHDSPSGISGSKKPTGTLPGAGANIHGLRWAPSSYTQYRQNGDINATAATPIGSLADANTPLRVGKAVVYSTILGGGDALNGDLAEIVVFASSLSENETKALEGYLACKWGTRDRLPMAHPFYHVTAAEPCP